MTVYLAVNREKDVDCSVALSLCGKLLSAGIRVVSDDADLTGSFSGAVSKGGFDRCDMVVSVGGDGTFLHLADEASERNIPILGVNMGHVGYLTRVTPDDNSWIEKLVTGEYHTEERMMLDVVVFRGEESMVKRRCLNDAVLSRAPAGRMLSVNVECDGRRLTEYYADGLIFATPTGSTAYSLSCGGPVIDPGLEAVAITPICAHSLAARPVIFKPSSVLEATLVSAESDACLSLDGRNNTDIRAGDRVVISVSSFKTKLVCFEKQSFYKILSEKLK